VCLKLNSILSKLICPYLRQQCGNNFVIQIYILKLQPQDNIYYKHPWRRRATNRPSKRRRTHRRLVSPSSQVSHGAVGAVRIAGWVAGSPDKTNFECFVGHHCKAKDSGEYISKDMFGSCCVPFSMKRELENRCDCQVFATRQLFEDRPNKNTSYLHVYVFNRQKQHV